MEIPESPDAAAINRDLMAAFEQVRGQGKEAIQQHLRGLAVERAGKGNGGGGGSKGRKVKVDEQVEEEEEVPRKKKARGDDQQAPTGKDKKTKKTHVEGEVESDAPKKKKKHADVSEPVDEAPKKKKKADVSEPVDEAPKKKKKADVSEPVDVVPKKKNDKTANNKQNTNAEDTSQSLKKKGKTPPTDTAGESEGSKKKKKAEIVSVPEKTKKNKDRACSEPEVHSEDAPDVFGALKDFNLGDLPPEIRRWMKSQTGAAGLKQTRLSDFKCIKLGRRFRGLAYLHPGVEKGMGAKNTCGGGGLQSTLRDFKCVIWTPRVYPKGLASKLGGAGRKKTKTSQVRLYELKGVKYTKRLGYLGPGVAKETAAKKGKTAKGD